MGLGDWTISTEFVEELEGGGDEEFLSAMRVFVYWEYKNAVIKISHKALKDRTKKEVERLIVHELAHCLVDEIKEGGIKHEERVATNLTNAFIWVRNETRREK